MQEMADHTDINLKIERIKELLCNQKISDGLLLLTISYDFN